MRAGFSSIVTAGCNKVDLILPVLHAAFAGGRVSYSKLRAVTRVATAVTDAHWLNLALNSTAAQCEKMVRQCRRGDEAENLVQENARNDQRWFRMYHDAMGMLVIVIEGLVGWIAWAWLLQWRPARRLYQRAARWIDGSFGALLWLLALRLMVST